MVEAEEALAGQVLLDKAPMVLEGMALAAIARVGMGIMALLFSLYRQAQSPTTRLLEQCHSRKLVEMISGRSLRMVLGFRL